MQISSLSQRQSSSPIRLLVGESGFTLVELLVSIAIIGVVSSIVLVRYNSFDSVVLLKNAAYEVALAVRDVQVRSVSVVRSSGSFDYPYGVTFTPNEKTYTMFRFESATEDPKYSAGSIENLSTVTLPNSLRIEDVCVLVGNSESCESDITRLDISFRRPEFQALFYAEGYGGVQDNIERAFIKVGSANSALGNFIVEVTKFGQISVYKE